MTHTQAQLDAEFEEMLANLPDEAGEYDLDLARLILRTLRNHSQNFVVHVEETLGTVSIRESDDTNEDIFLQGHEAEEFIANANELYVNAGHISPDEAHEYLALPYIENNWN